MFGWLKRNPVDKLKRQYEDKLREARDTQRNGDIVGYSRLIAESEEILQKIDSLEATANQ